MIDKRDIQYHPRVRADIAGILDWYDARSDTAGDRFFAEFENTIQGIANGTRNGYRLNDFSKKIQMKKFPYSISYEITEELIYIFVVKHQKRPASLGMNRKRPSHS